MLRWLTEMGFTLTVSGGKKAAQHIARLSSVPPLEVVAGYPADLPPHPGALHRFDILQNGFSRPPGSEEGTGIQLEGEGASIPTIAAKNEFGGGGSAGGSHSEEYEGVVSPERPFMRPAFDANRDDYKRRIYRIARSIITRQGADPQAMAADLGAKMTADIKHQIDITTAPGNTARTIWKKLDADHPLIDSGTMRESTTFRVRI